MRIGFVFIIALAVVAPRSNALTAIRSPIALANAGDDLLVANRRSGTICVIDARLLHVVAETQIGHMLSDVAATRDGRFVYVTDEAAGELIRLERVRNEWRISARIRVPEYPVSVRVAPIGNRITVASLWSRRLAIVQDERVRSVNLPFAPREQVIEPDGTHVIVADAFGGNLARIDLSSRTIAARRSIEAHNVRGLAWTTEQRELLIAHQLLDDHTPSESSRITWGQVIANVLRAVPVNEVTAGATRQENVGHWSLYPLGKNGRGAGDPGAVVVTRSGFTAVALSGVNEVAIRHSALDPFQRISVGRRPTALAVSRDESRLFVTNTSDDSISVIDLPSARVISTISLGPRPDLSERDRGEQLFYDARLSVEGWYSCNSCHPNGHTTGGRNDNFSDGSFGTPKQIPSLLGVEETRPWGWNGQMQTHEMQVHQSILGTMRGPASAASPDNVNAIAAFIRSLPAAPSLAAARGELDDPAVSRGRAIFAELRCGRCHQVPEFTSERTYDVGLSDEAGVSSFNPPSLLGVSQRDAFLHDGRARTLDEVLTKYHHPGGKGSEGKSVDDLVAFLQSL